MKTDLEFTVADGLKVQSEHLARWAKLLKPEIYAKVAEEAARQNQRRMDSGLDVWRGTDINQFVMNLPNEL